MSVAILLRLEIKLPHAMQICRRMPPDGVFIIAHNCIVLSTSVGRRFYKAYGEANAAARRRREQKEQAPVLRGR